VTLEQSRQAAEIVMQRIAGRLPPAIRAMADLHAAVLPLRDQIVGSSKRLLLLLKMKRAGGSLALGSFIEVQIYFPLATTPSSLQVLPDSTLNSK